MTHSKTLSDGSIKMEQDERAAIYNEIARFRAYLQLVAKGMPEVTAYAQIYGEVVYDETAGKEPLATTAAT